MGHDMRVSLMKFPGLCSGAIVLAGLMCAVVAVADWPDPCDDICGVDQWVGETGGPMPEYHYVYFGVDWGKQGPHILVCDCGTVIPARGTVVLLGYDPTDESGYDPNSDTWTDDWAWNNCWEKGGEPFYGVQPYSWTKHAKIDCEFDPCYFYAPTCENPGDLEIGLPKTDCETLIAIDDGNLTVTVNAQAYNGVRSVMHCTQTDGWDQCIGWSAYCSTCSPPPGESCTFDEDEIEGRLRGTFLPTLTFEVDVLFPDGNPCKKK